jgi:hypothetical protein
MGGPVKAEHPDPHAWLAELDNFNPSPFVCGDGREWKTSEHYFQACKFTDSSKREAVRTTPDGLASWQEGNARHESFDPLWDEHKLDVMYQANLLKYQQNRHHRSVLCSTSGLLTAKGGWWKVWNEVLLERIREELKPESDQDSDLLLSRRRLMGEWRSAARSGSQAEQEACTRYAGQRKPVPRAEDFAPSIVIAGDGVAPWMIGTFDVDIRAPSTNGQWHYACRIGDAQEAHFFLGCKRERKAWVLDQDYSPTEAAGAAVREVGAMQATTVPKGPTEFLYWDDAAWKTGGSQRKITLTITPVPGQACPELVHTCAD